MLHWFAETTLVASGLAAIAAVACRWGRLGPGTRHALWLVVLLKLVTPPLLHLPIPADWPGLGSSDNEAVSLDVVPAPEPPPAFEPLATADIWLVEPPPEVLIGEAMPPAEPPEIDPLLWAVPQPPEPIVHLMERPEAPPEPAAVVATTPAPQAWTPDVARLSSWLLAGWALGALGLLGVDLSRIVRFTRRVRQAVEAPDWVSAELEALGERLDVRPPRAVIVPGVGTPMLWCLGRPTLVLPPELLKSLGRDAWPGVLAHELAHIRRGDPWVGRLALLASWLWWWNPLFWLARARLEAEAELACDAWVLWALPESRRRYAEALVDVCAQISKTVAPVPSPSWGVGGAGRFFERRLTMILRSRGTTEPPKAASLAVAMVALFALPTWTPAQDDPRPRDGDRPQAEGREDQTEEVVVEGRPVAERRHIEVQVRKVERQDDGPDEVVIEGRPVTERRHIEVQVRKAEQDEGEKESRPVHVQLRTRVRGAGDEAKSGDEAKGDREEAQKALEAARAEFQEAQAQFHSRMREVQSRMQTEMREVQEEFQKAQREFAKAQQSLSKDLFKYKAGEAVYLNGDPVRVEVGRGADVRTFFVPSAPGMPGMPAVPGMPMPPRPPAPPEGGPEGENLSRRVGDLEKKFDQILEELRGMRRDREER